MQGRIQGGGGGGAALAARLTNFFKCAPPNLKSWIRPCNLPIFSVHDGRLFQKRVVRTKFDIYVFINNT